MTFNRAFAMFAAVLMLATSSFMPVVQAISPEQRKIFEDGIPYFNFKDNDCNPQAASGAGGGPEACAGLAGKDKTEQAYNFFTGKQFTPRQSAAIVGNLLHESQLDPVIVNPTSGAFGIAQWLGARRDSPDPKVGLKSYAASKSQDYKSFCVQLDFIWHEITEGSEKTYDVIGKMKAKETELAGRSDDEVLTQLALVWENTYERAAGAGLSQRSANAKDVFSLYGGNAAGAGGSAAGGSSASCGNNSGGVVAGNIVQTAIGLAWPEPFKKANPPEPGRTGPLTPKPAYTDAMNKSNPGQRADGADCGIFVATVMRASGADPDFPTSYTTAQYEYMLGKADKYQNMGQATSTGTMQPGDIVVITAAQRGTGAGHIFIFVGPQPGGYISASASLDERSANLANDDFAGYTVFRPK